MVQMRLLPVILLGALASASSLLPQRSVTKREQPKKLVANVVDFHDNPEEVGFPNMTSSKYTDYIVAFAETTANGSVAVSNDAVRVLPGYVQAAHAQNVSVHLGVGGFTGSVYFSTSVATQENRTKFIQEIMDLAFKYSMQGVNLAWQFPNVNLTCNTVSSNDLDNYLKLIQEMRNSTVLQHLTISATVPVKPWVNASGNHAENLSDFAQVLDFIELMNYDTWNTGQSVVGANSPLDDGCAPAGDQRGSVTKTVNTWKSAGFSQDQILVGAPTYGYLYNVPLDAAYSNGVLAQYPPTNGSGSSLMGDSWSAPEDPHWCSGLQPAHTMTFASMIEAGYLDSSGNNQTGIDYRFDNCSQTPYVYNHNTGIMISYENPQSFYAKGAYIRNNTLAGAALWKAGGDYHDLLIDAMRAAPVKL